MRLQCAALSGENASERFQWSDVRAVEGARLESVYTAKPRIEGSNPSRSASFTPSFDGGLRRFLATIGGKSRQARKGATVFTDSGAEGQPAEAAAPNSLALWVCDCIHLGQHLVVRHPCGGHRHRMRASRSKQLAIRQRERFSATPHTKNFGQPLVVNDILGLLAPPMKSSKLRQIFLPANSEPNADEELLEIPCCTCNSSLLVLHEPTISTTCTLNSTTV